MVMQLCWGSRSPIAELCPTRVGVMFDCRGYQSREVSRGWARDSLLGVIYEATGIFDLLIACGASEAAGHASQSLRLAKS